MKAILAISAVFVILQAWALVTEWIVSMGMDPIEEADAEPVIFEHIDGVFVPPVRR